MHFTNSKLQAILITAGYAILISMSVYLLDFVKERSVSAAVDFLSITAWAMMTLVVSFFETVLVSGLICRIKRGGKGGDEIAAFREFRLNVFHKSIFFAVFVGANFLLSNAASGNFWSGYYAKKGVYMTVLRGGEPEKVKWAFDRIAKMPDENIAAFLEPVADFLDSGDAGLRKQAALCLGEIARRMNSSVSMLSEKEIKENRWEIAVLAAIRKDVLPKLIESFKKDGDEVRSAAAYAIGASGSSAAQELFLQYLLSPGRSDVVVKEIVMAAYLSGRFEALKTLEHGVGTKDGTLQALSLYAAGGIIAAIGVDDRARLEAASSFLEMVKERSGSLSLEGKCAFVDALAKVRDAGFTGLLISLFESRDGDVICGRVEVGRYYTAPVVVTAQGAMRHKILNALAGIAVGNEEVLNFLKKVASDEGYPDDVKETAGKMIGELNSK